MTIRQADTPGNPPKARFSCRADTAGHRIVTDRPYMKFRVCLANSSAPSPVGACADARRCPHGHDISRPTRHVEDDPRLCQPLCFGCYEYEAAVLFNA